MVLPDSEPSSRQPPWRRDLTKLNRGRCHFTSCPPADHLFLYLLRGGCKTHLAWFIFQLHLIFSRDEDLEIFSRHFAIDVAYFCTCNLSAAIWKVQKWYHVWVMLPFPHNWPLHREKDLNGLWPPLNCAISPGVTRMIIIPLLQSSLSNSPERWESYWNKNVPITGQKKWLFPRVAQIWGSLSPGHSSNWLPNKPPLPVDLLWKESCCCCCCLLHGRRRKAVIGIHYSIQSNWNPNNTPS